MSIEVNQVYKQIVDCEVEFHTVGQGNIEKQERNNRIKWYGNGVGDIIMNLALV